MELRWSVRLMAKLTSGLFLSILVVMSTARKAVVEHRSVHTGDIVKIVPLELPETVWDEITWDIKMEWRENDLSWENPKVSLNIYTSRHS